MQRLNNTITKREISHLLNLRVTHHKASISILEALSFNNSKQASDEINKILNVKENLILQTCNRIEIFLAVSTEDISSIEEKIIALWSDLTGSKIDDIRKYIEISFSTEVMLHAMKLTSGLESMVIGENQIIGQVQKSIQDNKELDNSKSIIAKLFKIAIKVGRKVRTQTNISKGSVSIGSIAIKLLEEVVGDLKGKKVLIIGAGQIGTLAAKALAARKLAIIFVANRTYDRAIFLSRILNSKAVTFEKLTESLSTTDIVIVATSAPHNIISKKIVSEALKQRDKEKKLVIVDLSQPRNVEKEVETLPNVEVHNIDNLKKLSNSNHILRKKEAKKAENIIQQEIEKIYSSAKHEISANYDIINKANEIRCSELNNAYKKMNINLDSKKCLKCKKVTENLSKILVKRIISDTQQQLNQKEMEENIKKILMTQEEFQLDQHK